MNGIKKVLITGGAGYVGSVLVPKLLQAGYQVLVYDLFIYGDGVFDGVRNHPALSFIKADIRDVDQLDQSLRGVDAVIHLACISNDPSYELNPTLSKSINYDAFRPMVRLAKKHRVKRFVYASSSSVYGIKDDPEVTEDLALEPLTDYSKFKALCEQILLEEATDDFTSLVLRPATVCGYSPRLRLDLTVNILTNFAFNKGEIQVFGGAQKRPNIHIQDMAELYIEALRWSHEKIHKKIYNAGYENHTVEQLAETVRAEVGPHVQIRHVPTNDNRSYHVSSAKISRELGFVPQRTIREAVRELKEKFDEGKIPDSFSDSRYFNIKRMQEIHLQ